jgi:hypothetical protein
MNTEGVYHVIIKRVAPALISNIMILIQQNTLTLTLNTKQYNIIIHCNSSCIRLKQTYIQIFIKYY